MTSWCWSRLEGEDRRDYGRVLLSMADDGRRRFPGATTMANGGQNIKARIQAITRFKAFPRGMGLVSVCMVVTLTLSLVVGLPVSAADPLPGAVRLLGPVGSLSYALSHRPATVGGALDAYSKGIYASITTFRTVTPTGHDPPPGAAPRPGGGVAADGPGGLERAPGDRSPIGVLPHRPHLPGTLL